MLKTVLKKKTASSGLAQGEYPISLNKVYYVFDLFGL